MRIGIRLGAVVVGAVVAATSAGLAARADDAKRVQPVPLGGSVGYQTGEQHFGVYVPTKFGGELTLTTTSGRIESIVGPDGRHRTNGQDVGTNAHGWYSFTVAGAEGPYTVSTAFIQVA